MPDDSGSWHPDEVAELERAEAVHDVRQWLAGEIHHVDWRQVLPHVLADLDQLRSSLAAVRALAESEIDNRGECSCAGAPDFGGGVYGSHEGDCATNEPPMVHAHALLDALAAGGSVPSSGGTEP